MKTKSAKRELNEDDENDTMERKNKYEENVEIKYSPNKKSKTNASSPLRTLPHPHTENEPKKKIKSRKEKEEENVNSALKEADDEVNRETIAPSEEERKALAVFCEKSLKCKEKESLVKASVKELKEQISDLRKALFERMKHSGKECFVIPKDMLRRAEEEAQLKKYSLPPAYLRLKTNTKDLSITDDVITEAIDSLSIEDIDDQEDLKSGRAALVKAIIDIVRRNIREYKEQFFMSSSIPRGTRHVDIDDADKESAKMALDLFFAQQAVIENESSAKSDISELKQVIKTIQPKIESFFQRGNFTSQRVQLGDKPFTIMKRISVTRPKMNFKLFENIVNQGITDMFSHIKAKRDTKEDAVRFVSDETIKEDFKRLVLTKLASIPSTTRVSISLKAAKEQMADDEEIDNGEEDREDKEDKEDET